MLNYFRKKILDKLTKPYKILRNKDFISNNFKELNLEYKNYGNKNPNKFFYVIRREPRGGFFSNLNFVLHNLLICDKLKMIPIIDMENYPTIYNCKKKINGTHNSWLYYFSAVSKFPLKEVYKSKNVVLCDNRTSGSKYFNGFQNLKKEHYKIFKRYVFVNKDILKSVRKYTDREFLNKRILGVCFRGSDQKISGYQPFPPTETQMLNATNFLLKKYKFDKIYICTEDIEYLEFYKRNYKNKLLFSNCPRTTDKRDLFDGSTYNHRYKIGRGNLIDMMILSKTNHLLFANSNIPHAAIFYSKNRIPNTVLDNGMKGNIFIAQFSFRIKKFLPSFLGGFKNNILKS